MHEIRPAQVGAALTALFAPDRPAGLRCVAVLAGLETGRIFTDDLRHPTWGFVWEATDGTLYPAGAVTAPLVQQVVTLLRADGDVLIGYWFGDALASQLPPAPDYIGTVLEFLDRPTDLTDVVALIQHLPTG